jgi:hypothetical protein
VDRPRRRGGRDRHRRRRQRWRRRRAAASGFQRRQLSLRALLCAACFAAPVGAQTLDGGSGLLNVPSASVLDEGTAALHYGRTYPDLSRSLQTDVWYAGAGFAPGLELGGRAVATALRAGRRDLSLDAKYQLPFELAGVRLALGAQDVGGQERLLPREYAVATWTHGTLALSAGFGRGRNVLDGPFAGLEWRPWPLVGLVVEHDAEAPNAGLKLFTPSWAGWRAGVVAAWRGELEEMQYGAQLAFPLGRERREASPATRASPAAPAPAPAGAQPARIAAELVRLGFEAVRVGARGADTIVVRLENRRYNHAAADGLGLALGTIASLADPAVSQIELYLHAYGAPQLRVATGAAPYRAFLHDPAAVADALIEARPFDGIDDAAAVAWSAPAMPRRALELVAEPVLRTTVATPEGMLDYGFGVHARLTAPVMDRLLAHVGATVPVARSDDFDAGRQFAALAPEGGLDLALLQSLHTPRPGWSVLLSAGRAQVHRADLDTLALDQAWQPGAGAHRLRMKLMLMRNDEDTREIALAGYDWLDAARRYGIGLTAGRFFAGDAGARLDVERYFGDTILGLFWKFASPDDQAAGVALSLPLTPRRDALPRGVQLKGARRWSHALATTLNGPPDAEHPAGTNPIRPLLLHEPVLELDLERDLLDAGRLGAESLRASLPRLHEAYWTLRDADASAPPVAAPSPTPSSR